MIRQESLWAEVQGTEHRLHVRRICPADQQSLGPPVLLLHGSIENGRIFYTESGKGLAPFLAERGFDVFVADLRGRGLSTPAISRGADHGQYHSIVEDLSRISDLISELRGPVAQVWGSHSWGGVFMMSHLVRFPERAKRVAGVFTLGTKRVVAAKNWDVAVKLNFVWNLLSPALCKVFGYLPAKKFGFGADSETSAFLRECRQWVKGGDWVDGFDGFDYGRAALTTSLPPLFFVAAHNDPALGNPADVRAFIRELGEQNVEFRLLARHAGSLHDYDHINMLTHPDAVRDHFVELERFCRTVVGQSHSG